LIKPYKEEITHLSEGKTEEEAKNKRRSLWKRGNASKWEAGDEAVKALWAK
jgi:hypothetical protein